jgi:hypothetical protein
LDHYDRRFKKESLIYHDNYTNDYIIRELEKLKAENQELRTMISDNKSSKGQVEELRQLE